jgi:hypothetical protein
MKKQFIQRIICGVAALSASMGIATSASAVEPNETVGKVMDLWINDSTDVRGLMYQISLDSKERMQPCAISGRFVTRDRAIYDLAMTARLTGKTVHIFGQPECYEKLQKIGFIKIDV